MVGGRYEIIDAIGSGGMAVVYRALDTKLDRRVALKVMREEFAADEEFIGRFNIEAQAAASLSNSNIVNVYDVGHEGDVHYIVMEYVSGATLKELIKKKAPLDNNIMLGVMIQIATGLSHAHQKQIVHRDIKPQNILVTNDGGVKVTDFGIARASNTGTLTGGNTMGSVHYFSPEQARGGFVDHKSDIYSLGIVMYEMMTGRLPFEGEAVVTVALKHINDPLPEMEDFNPNVSESVRRIILKATEKPSSRRYQNVEEMILDMKRAISNPNGEFMDESDAQGESPTRPISQDDQDEIRRINRARPVDEDEPEENAPGVVEDDMDYEYESEPDEGPRNKKAERITIASAILAAIIAIVLITFAARYIIEERKPKPIPAPGLAGMSLDEARAAVLEAQLTLFVEASVHDEADEGVIVSQSEPPGTTMYKGDTIHVTLSLGPKFIEIPSLVMLTLEEALDLLGDLEITVEEIPDESETRFAGVVISQEPPAGMVQAGSVLKLYVSVGSEDAAGTVPFLLGKDENEAQRLIRAAGYAVGLVSREESTTYPAGSVCRQSPDPGDPAEQGAQISYTVSSGAPVIERPPDPTPEPTTAPTPTSVYVEPPPVPPPNGLVQYGYINIYLWEVPSGTVSVHMKIYEVSEDNPPKLIGENNVAVADFPYEFPVSGTGFKEYHVCSVENGADVLKVKIPVNFDDQG